MFENLSIHSVPIFLFRKYKICANIYMKLVLISVWWVNVSIAYMHDI